MTIADLFSRPKDAREAVLRQLATAHDVWSEEEQIALHRGYTIEAEGAHWHALIALQAYRAELDDTPPAMELPPYADACPRCLGIGSIRVRTGNGGQRVPCEECGGSGLMRPGPRP